MATAAKSDMRKEANETAVNVPVRQGERRSLPPGLTGSRAHHKVKPIAVKVTPRNEETAVLLERLAEAIRTPGISHDSVFGKTNGKHIYAYYVSAEDVNLFVREDAAGQKTLGKYVGGRFRPINVKVS